MGHKPKSAEGKAVRETVLSWSGDLTILQTTELKAAVLEAFGGFERVTVDLAGASGGDVALVQLLLAAQREAGAQGKGFALRGNVPGWFGDLIQSCGFSRWPGGSKEGLWLETDAPSA